MAGVPVVHRKEVVSVHSARALRHFALRSSRGRGGSTRIVDTGTVPRTMHALWSYLLSCTAVQHHVPMSQCAELRCPPTAHFITLPVTLQLPSISLCPVHGDFHGHGSGDPESKTRAPCAPPVRNVMFCVVAQTNQFGSHSRVKDTRHVSQRIVPGILRPTDMLGAPSPPCHPPPGRGHLWQGLMTTTEHDCRARDWCG